MPCGFDKINLGWHSLYQSEGNNDYYLQIGK